jgi:hypothetical protein
VPQTSAPPATRRGSVPARSALEPGEGLRDEDLAVALDSPDCYNACMHITDSDHKPVFALLTVRLAQCKQDVRRARTLELIRNITAAAGAQSPGLQVRRAALRWSSLYCEL